MLAVLLAGAFALTNGFHDASNAIATLVATRGATPGQAVVLSAVFNMLGALFLGAAVADTIGGLITVPAEEMVAVVGAGLAGAVTWNLLTWWRGLPSSSGHALVGGLVGSALVAAGPAGVNWGGMDGIHPKGVIGVLVALFVSPFIGFGVGWALDRGLVRWSHRWTPRWQRPVVYAQWVTAGSLSYSHGGNDAAKSSGVVAALLLAAGVTSTFEVPRWTSIFMGFMLTLGTALGGWRIVRTIGRRIFPITPLDSFASQTASTGVIFGASLIGAPVSTTQVVASSVAGVGGGRQRWRHVGWEVVREMLIAWVTTIPAAAVLSIGFYYLWKAVAG